MTGLIILLILLFVVGPLSIYYGTDSRINDDRDGRGWWPGARRS